MLSLDFHSPQAPPSQSPPCSFTEQGKEWLSLQDRISKEIFGFILCSKHAHVTLTFFNISIGLEEEGMEAGSGNK